VGDFMFGFVSGAIVSGAAVGWVAGLVVRRVRQENIGRLGGILTVVGKRGGYRPMRSVDPALVIQPRGPSAVVPFRRVR
jgi:hypothetical protein